MSGSEKQSSSTSSILSILGGPAAPAAKMQVAQTEDESAALSPKQVAINDLPEADLEAILNGLNLPETF